PVFLVLTSLAARTDCGGTGRVQGRVVDKDGNSVVGAEVTILSEECVVVGIEPSAKSQSNGSFELNNVPIGRVGVYASKPKAGYPDTRFAIYSIEPESVAKVVVRHDEVTSGVTVSLGAKAGTIFGAVLDRETLKPILSARLVLSKTDNDRIMFST